MLILVYMSNIKLFSKFSIGHNYNTSPRSKQTIDSLWHLMHVILDSLDFKVVVQKIVDSVLVELGYMNLGYSIVVLALIDDETKTLKRISISHTQKAKEALDITPVPFRKINIPLSAKRNACIQSLDKDKVVTVKDWSKLLVPPYTKENAKRIQDHLGIKASMVYPVHHQGKPRGILIFSMTKDPKEVTAEEIDLISGFTDVVGLAVQNSRLYSALEKSSAKITDANKRLQEMDKQKDEFINMAAHELRAPMTAIKGYISMIMDGDAGKIPDQAVDYLADVMSVTDRLVRLVNNMLNVGRIEEGRMVYRSGMVSLKDIAHQVFVSFRFEAERKGLIFKVEESKGVKDLVIVDPDRIHEVVGNFVSNAVKYTETGFVSMRITNPQKGTVKFEVIDSGPGISSEEQTKLFQKFFRVESTAGKTIGTGLGLYISKLLIEKFNGKIGLDSDINKGSSFWFELPVVDEKEAQRIIKESEALVDSGEIDKSDNEDHKDL